MHIVTWNLNRHAPTSPEGRTLSARIRDEAPDIICLTEAHEGSLDGFDGHVLATTGARLSSETGSERKVVLWSKSPWTTPIPLGDVSSLGGAIGATTETPLGAVQVVGVFIPDHLASPAGLEPRAKPWSEHVKFLEALAPALKSLDPALPVVIVGDFNQQVPDMWGLKEIRDAFSGAFGGFDIVTSGDIGPASEAAVDHVAVSPGLRAAKVQGLSRLDANGKALSEHFGVSVVLEPGVVQIFD